MLDSLLRTFPTRCSVVLLAAGLSRRLASYANFLRAARWCVLAAFTRPSVRLCACAVLLVCLCLCASFAVVRSCWSCARCVLVLCLCRACAVVCLCFVCAVALFLKFLLVCVFGPVCLWHAGVGCIISFKTAAVVGTAAFVATHQKKPSAFGDFSRPE